MPKTIPGHSMLLLEESGISKMRKKIEKEVHGKKHSTHRGEKIRMTSDFSSETTEARREWSKIFKPFREKSHLPECYKIILQK